MEDRAEDSSSATMSTEQDQHVAPLQPVSDSTPHPDDSATDDEPQTREDFFKYYCHITLDPNTAYKELRLSESNRKVELMEIVQTYPEHPDRFTHLFQVLSTEALTGRCYWEVEFEGSVEVAVAYKDLGRSDYYHQCAFGCNDKSWSVDLNKNYKCFRHNDEETTVPSPPSSRVGVFLDHEAGTLTFYCVCDNELQLMHKVKTTFTQPLFAGLWVAGNARFCDLK